MRDLDEVREELIKILSEPDEEGEAPGVVRRVTLCKDCKFFEVDHFSNIFGPPIIVAHNICGRLEIASKPDGFCFLASPKDSEELTKNEDKA